MPYNVGLGLGASGFGGLGGTGGGVGGGVGGGGIMWGSSGSILEFKNVK